MSQHFDISLSSLVDAIKFEHYPGKGIGVKAAKSFAPGNVIFKKRAQVYVPLADGRSTTCASCFKVALGKGEKPFLSFPDGTEDLFACAKCRSTYYCSKQCQVHDWVLYHRHECKQLAAMPAVPPSYVILMMRVFSLRGESRTAFFNQFNLLKDHEYLKPGTKEFDDLLLFSKGAKEYSKTRLNDHEALRFFAKGTIHSATIVSSLFDSVGIMLDLLLARINHSCQPNCVLVFDGSVFSVVAMANINDGDEITISYIDNTQNKRYRKRELKKRYFFDCVCEKCNAPENDWFKCPNCNAGFACDEVSRECNNCHVNLPKSPDELDTELQSNIAELESVADFQKSVQQISGAFKTGMVLLHRSPLAHQISTHFAYFKHRNSCIEMRDVAAAEYFNIDPLLFKGLPKFYPIRIAHGARLLYAQICNYVDKPSNHTIASLWALANELKDLLTDAARKETRLFCWIEGQLNEIQKRLPSLSLRAESLDLSLDLLSARGHVYIQSLLGA
ncbi:hypothetical protein V1514DRAFT_324933 [Lipomyces japonicus]|uniref:uncharacterized protein n=1 Tax=Lipomyces japonicus TaxID=56871 RepID=UPI0034CFBE8F